MTDGPIVSEEDREAAATLCEHIENDKGEPVSSWAIDLIRAGKADHHCTVQAFARHRLSTQSAMQARIEKLEAALEWAMSYARNQSTDEEGLARAESALSSAIGEQHEFSGWVEVVDEDRER